MLTINRYWSTNSLFHGLWARHFMSRDRFKVLLVMLHVSDPTEEQFEDKLCKVRLLLNHIKKMSAEFFFYCTSLRKMCQ